MSTLYKGHDLNEHQANELENHLLYKFAYDRGIDLDDFPFHGRQRVCLRVFDSESYHAWYASGSPVAL